MSERQEYSFEVKRMGVAFGAAIDAVAAPDLFKDGIFGAPLELERALLRAMMDRIDIEAGVDPNNALNEAGPS